MKKLLALFFCLMATFSSFAQDKRPLIKLSPLPLIDIFSFPTIQGGFEFLITRKISWYNEFGIRYMKEYDKPDTSFVVPSGFKAKTEFRYYLGKSFGPKLTSQLEGFYVAVNFFYIKDVHNTSIRYYYQKDSTVKVGDDFGVRKTIWGGNFLGGYQLAHGKRIMVEMYVGVGVRFRDIITENKEYVYKRDELVRAIDLTVAGFKYDTESRGGQSVAPNFTLGLRVAFKL